MGGDGLYVALECVDVGEYVVVDALEHVVGGVGAGGRCEVGVVDESVAEWPEGGDGGGGCEMPGYFDEFFH